MCIVHLLLFFIKRRGQRLLMFLKGPLSRWLLNRDRNIYMIWATNWCCVSLADIKMGLSLILKRLMVVDTFLRTVWVVFIFHLKAKEVYILWQSSRWMSIISRWVDPLFIHFNINFKLNQIQKIILNQTFWIWKKENKNEFDDIMKYCFW